MRGLSPFLLRLALVIATPIYAASLHYAHIQYLYPLWAYFGFTYRPMGAGEVALAAALLLVGSLLMPVEMGRTSSVIMACLYVAVYVPAIVISLGVDKDRLDSYIPILLSLCGAFVAASMASRLPATRPRDGASLPGYGFTYTIAILWLGCVVILVAQYWSIMSLVSLAEVYQQREAGRSTSMIVGYIQTYFAFVFSPALIALGLAKRLLHWSLLGVIGCMIMYMIDAQRTVFLLPLAMFALHFALCLKSGVLKATATAVLALATLVTLSTAFYPLNHVASVFSQYLTFRTLAFPGLTYSLYYDLFRQDGFTWWSHVRGIGSIVPVPQAFINDPHWPGLGYIVADRVHNMESNANANLFAGDGVAAGGAIGTLVIGVIFAAYLVVLDWAARRWNRHFTMLIALPIGITLINGQFFTTMLSFGGIFWIALLILFEPRSRHREYSTLDEEAP